MTGPIEAEPPRCDCGLPASIGDWCSNCYICDHGDLKARLRAFGRDCVLNGDMTPPAELMLHRILDGER